MNLTGSDARRKLLDWAEGLQQFVETRDRDAAHQIQQAVESYRKQRFVLTVLGKAKRGKSTLINALLGRRDDLLAPVDHLPASNVLSRFRRGEQLTARVLFRPGESEVAASEQIITPSQIRDFVTEEGNPENRRQVECVEVAGPFSGFDEDLILIDTPGAGSIHTYHDDIVRAVIPQSDAVIFLVTARMPIDQDELELIRQLQQADIRKILFVINRVDQSPSGELEQAESHNRALLQQVGISVERLYRLSAKRAFEGLTDDSGLPALAADIRRLLQESKAQMLAERLTSRIRLLTVPLLQGLDAEIALLGQTARERQQVRDELASQRIRCERERGQAERRFEFAWQRALDRMALDVKAVRGDVEQRLMQRIGSVTVAGVGKLAKEFPQRLVVEVETAVRPHAEQLETSLQAACRELDATYPVVDLAELGAVGPVRTKGSLAPSLIYGTTLAAGGGAALAAAQAAAASAFQVVTSQSLLGAGLSWLIGTEVPLLTTAVVPVALPAWAIIAGPVGWTLIGLGALAVPFGWTLSRTRMKEQLRDQARDQIDQVFRFLLEDRLPFIRNSAPLILDEYRARADRQLLDLETAVARAESAPDAAAERLQLTALRDSLSRRVENRELQNEGR